MSGWIEIFERIARLPRVSRWFSSEENDPPAVMTMTMSCWQHRCNHVQEYFCTDQCQKVASWPRCVRHTCRHHLETQCTERCKEPIGGLWVY